MPVISATAAVDHAIAAARSLPALIRNLESINPALAKQLEAKPLLFAKSPPAVLLAYAIGWASTKYGLGLDADTSALLAGLVLLLASYGMRAITRQPTSGLVAVVPPAIASGAEASPGGAAGPGAAA